MDRYDFGAKLFVAILLLLVISDQLTSPSPDPRDAALPQPSAERKLLEPAGGVDIREAALEEASLLLKLADRAIPYANAPLVEAAAALGVAPSDTPQMELSPPRRRPRRTPRSDASPEAEPPHPAAHVAEPAVAARRSERPAAAAAAVTDDPTCHTAAHTGYSGDRAVVWGLGKPGFHLNTSAECCDACKAHAATCSQKGAGNKAWWPTRPEMRCGGNPPCNMWTHCPEERCFAFDIHIHTFGECWLKHQAVNLTHAKDPHEGSKTYPSKMRFAPRAIWPWAVREDVWSGPMPEYIPWTSGVLAPADAVVSSAPPDDQWKRRWCSKHGPCD